MGLTSGGDRVGGLSVLRGAVERGGTWAGGSLGLGALVLLRGEKKRKLSSQVKDPKKKELKKTNKPRKLQPHCPFRRKKQELT